MHEKEDKNPTRFVAGPEKIALSVAEAAGLIGISTKTMYEWAKTTGFPAAKIGGRVIIYYDGLKEWLRKQTEAFT